MSLVSSLTETRLVVSNSFKAYHDAAHIQKLTKSDMIDFFMHYICPSSPTRAKLAIHLHARGISETPTSPEAIPNGIISYIEKEVEADALRTGSNVVINPESVIPQVNGANGATRTPYVIENVREFRSRLAVSAGPQPVKDLSEFEELDSKL